MKLRLIFLILIFSTLMAEERPRTFSADQEMMLAHNPKVLSFLFHMTRNRLNFNEMADKYNLNSVSLYYNFLLENEFIKELKDGNFEFLFLNPYGVWALRTHDQNAIYQHLRKKGLHRLSQMIESKPVNLEDDNSAIWTVNTTWLTSDQYQEYKKDILQICKKYIDLGEQSLLNNTIDRQAVWMMYLADKVPSEVANTSHILFGSIEEF